MPGLPTRAREAPAVPDKVFEGLTVEFGCDAATLTCGDLFKMRIADEDACAGGFQLQGATASGLQRGSATHLLREFRS